MKNLIRIEKRRNAEYGVFLQVKNRNKRLATFTTEERAKKFASDYLTAKIFKYIITTK